MSNKHAKRARRLISEICIKNTPLGIFYQIAVFISSLLIGFSLFLLIPNTIKVYEKFPLYVTCLVILVIGVVIYFSSKWFVNKKAIGKTGLLNSIITFVIESDKIVHYTDGGLRREITGNDIKKIMDYKEYLFVFVRDNYAYYIPPSAFTDSAQRDATKSEIQSIATTANKAFIPTPESGAV